MKHIAVGSPVHAFLVNDRDHLAEFAEQFAGQPTSLNSGECASEDAPLTSADLASKAFLDVLSRAGVGVVQRGADGEIITVNDFYCRLVGRTQEALVDLPMQAYSHRDEVDALLDLYAHHLPHAEPFQIERRYLRPDGTTRWAAVNVSFLCDAEGRPTSSVDVVLDITARREDEAKLKESEVHYRTTVEFAPQINWTASPDGSVDEVSPR